METKATKRRVGDVASVAVLCAAVLLCITVALQVAARGYASVMGYSLFRVITGSMEPTIPVNAVIVCRSTDIHDVAVGDVVVFRLADLSGEKIITHRVSDIHTQSDGTVTLETRGDANPVADTRPVTQSGLIGKVVWYTDKEGGATKVIGFLSGSMGFLTCIVFPIILIGALILRGSITSIRRQLREIDRQMDQAAAMPPESGSLTPEEYQELYEKVRAEVLEELKNEHEK